jgi:hypothetical protein
MARGGLLLTAGVALLAGCAASAPASPAGPAIEDQIGGRWPIAEIVAGPAFIIIGGASASERSTRWDIEVVGPLASRLGWDVHRVLRLSGYPRIVRGAVVSRVRASARPPETPILLDWDDEVSRRVSCPDDDTTVVVLDPRGEELGRLRGEPGPTAAAEIEMIVSGGGAP